MMVRKMMAALAAAASLSMAVGPAYALEIREPSAHLAFNIPDGWNIDKDGRFVRAAPPDKTFHLRVVGLDHAWRDQGDAEAWLVSIVNEHIDSGSIDLHARRIEDWHGFEGWEIRGHGKRKFDGKDARFSNVVLRDRKDTHKGVVALGIGTPEGFDKHHPGVYEALHSLRVWNP